MLNGSCSEETSYKLLTPSLKFLIVLGEKLNNL